jgi:hypothetical protein
MAILTVEGIILPEKTGRIRKSPLALRKISKPG